MRVAGTTGLLLAVLLAGCAPAHSNDAVGNAAATSAPATTFPAVAPAVACPQLPAEHLPAHPGPVEAAYVCGSDTRPMPGDGIWSFQVVRRVTGGLDRLLAAYAVPDAGPPPSGTACPAIAELPLVVFLHTASRTQAVRAPWSDCHLAVPAARSAYDSLATTVVWERKDRQVQTQQSVESGCPEQYKDMLAVEEKFPSSGGTPAAVPAALAAPLLQCTYRVTVDAQGDRVGNLQGYRTLTATQVAAINRALRSVRVDATCSRHEQTRFAVLGPDRGPATYVALDGCAVAQDPAGWWRAGDDLRAALAG